MIITRGNTQKALTIANGAAITDALPMLRHTDGILLMPAAWTAASVGFQFSNAETGTYYKLYDRDGNLVQIDSPAAANAYALPAEVFTAPWVKLWSQDGSGSDENQGAARTLTLLLKS